MVGLQGLHQGGELIGVEERTIEWGSVTIELQGPANGLHLILIREDTKEISDDGPNPTKVDSEFRLYLFVHLPSYDMSLPIKGL